jgi:Uma2 family endonuclease
VTLSINKKIDTEETSIQAWKTATWEEFLAISDRYPQAKLNYYCGSYQIIMEVGADHATLNSLVDFLINLFCLTSSIPIKSFANASYRQHEVQECQPDNSYYLNDSVKLAPKGSSVVDLDEFLPPCLVVEISDSSLSSDMGLKRMLYEEMQIQEYWVIDVQKSEVIAFAIRPNLGSKRIIESQVLKGLSFSLIEEAIQKSKEMDNSLIGRWFMDKIRNGY